MDGYDDCRSDAKSLDEQLCPSCGNERHAYDENYNYVCEGCDK